MTSDQAADWVIQTYALENPDWGLALDLIPQRSWGRPDQMRLARYYLAKMPFASEKPYRVFAEIMSFKRFVEVLRECLPLDRSKMDLLIYHVCPVLSAAAKTDADRELEKSFIEELRM
ncbi:hypothetical protein [Ralstonia pseudosolanacearum]|uniref:hypothetical protein n=1 Tax=Ralstonia pseudosolanacearum TaxID=1310165 RepID=UPI0020041FAE|nr:hypothetical protein [Ralstonia pseudosolanacearum]MCK4155501.1 hypothetical protein [Ralstonia pseudosolanacearum]